MKTKTFLIILALSGILVSCIPSLYPLYKMKDLLLNNQLEGTFGSDDSDYWQFHHIDKNIESDREGEWKTYQSGYTYRLSVMEDGELEQFAVHLLKLGNDLYMDFFPVGYSIKPAFLEMHLAPSHIFAKAEISEPYLILHFFDMDWLEELIEKNLVKISYLKIEDRYLLTAGTEELQKFVTKFANDSTTFIEADTLVRIPVRSLACFPVSQQEGLNLKR